MRAQIAALLLTLLISAAWCFLAAQENAALSAIHARLEDPHRLAQHHAFVFVGRITRMQTVKRQRCSSGVEEKLEYTIDALLWNDPDTYARIGGKASKGYIDCNQKRLPAPFAVETKVIGYCETGHGYGDTCLPPAQYSDERLKRVQGWIDELRQKEGDPVLLQIHEHLRDTIELVPERPFLFAGEVTWIEKLTGPRLCLVCVQPRFRMTVKRLLWGYERQNEVESACPLSDCSAFSIGAKVIASCASIDPNYIGPQKRCAYVAASYTDENLRRTEEWVAQARLRQRELILEKIRNSLEQHTDASWVPRVYRGHAESFGKADNGAPLVRFVDSSEGGKSRRVTILFHLPYPPPQQLAMEIDKPVITFCYERDEACYVGEEATGVIDDSDEMFATIRNMLAKPR